MKCSQGIRYGFLLCCILAIEACFLGCHAQGQTSNIKARKFDEFRIALGDGMDETSRLARYARQLKKEPQTQAYIIAYSPRLRNVYGSDYWDIAENRLLTTKAQLVQYGVRERRLIGVDGGIREDTKVELWILPHGASPPRPRPEFQSSDVVHCHPVSVSNEWWVFKDAPLKYSAIFGSGKPDIQVSFQWSVSGGAITGGQGTDSIVVDVSGISDKSVTATVEVKGLPLECKEKATTTTTIIGAFPFKLDEFQENVSEILKIRLDYLSALLNKDPSLQGYIIVYGGRVGSRGDAAGRAFRAKDYLMNIWGLSPDSFLLAQGGYRENLMFEIWLVKRGSTLPQATPTVDERYVRFTGIKHRKFGDGR